VSKTPGKTKHVQTIVIPGTPLLLCDCPGLVFPSFMSTKNEMVCNGLLRISELKEIYGPVRLICNNIPRPILEQFYGITLPPSKESPNGCPTPHDLLDRYGYIRGFMTRNGQPDHQRAGKKMLSDYVEGRLLYCYPPPGVKEEEFNILEERLAAIGCEAPAKTVDSKIASESLDKTVEVEEEDFDLDIGDAFDVQPIDASPSDYDKRIKPKGRKAQKRLKQKQQSDGIAYSTDNRMKGGKITEKHKAEPAKALTNRQGSLPTRVKLIARQDAILVQETK